MTNTLKLPSWAKIGSDGVIELKPSVFYPAFMVALGYKKTTQGALETCRRVATRYLLLNFKPKDKPLKLHITRDQRFKLTNFPVGVESDLRAELQRLIGENKIPK